jgi:hypothetical protein
MLAGWLAGWWLTLPGRQHELHVQRVLYIPNFQPWQAKSQGGPTCSILRPSQPFCRPHCWPLQALFAGMACSAHCLAAQPATAHAMQSSAQPHGLQQPDAKLANNDYNSHTSEQHIGPTGVQRAAKPAQHVLEAVLTACMVLMGRARPRGDSHAAQEPTHALLLKARLLKHERQQQRYLRMRIVS